MLCTKTILCFIILTYFLNSDSIFPCIRNFCLLIFAQFPPTPIYSNSHFSRRPKMEPVLKCQGYRSVLMCFRFAPIDLFCLQFSQKAASYIFVWTLNKSLQFQKFSFVILIDVRHLKHCLFENISAIAWNSNLFVTLTISVP